MFFSLSLLPFSNEEDSNIMLYLVLCSFLASLVAVFGEFDISGELETKRSITKNVRRVIVNRGYDPATFENDLALLELESPVQFDEHIVPICMPDDGIDFTGRMATVTGWGRLKYSEYIDFGSRPIYKSRTINARARANLPQD